jgi:hypothetical protein
MIFVLENAHAYGKYRIQSCRNYPDFPKIHQISCVLTLKSLKMNLATLLKGILHALVCIYTEQELSEDNIARREM